MFQKINNNFKRSKIKEEQYPLEAKDFAFPRFFLHYFIMLNTIHINKNWLSRSREKMQPSFFTNKEKKVERKKRRNIKYEYAFLKINPGNIYGNIVKNITCFTYLNIRSMYIRLINTNHVYINCIIVVHTLVYTVHHTLYSLDMINIDS